jgi:hypothetical protein
MTREWEVEEDCSSCSEEVASARDWERAFWERLDSFRCRCSWWIRSAIYSHYFFD